MPRQKGDVSFQELSHDQMKHLVGLSRDGVFQGQPAAWQAAMYLALNLSTRDRDYGEVMPGCVSTSAIMAGTTLSRGGVSKAITWLREQGIIRVQYEYQGDLQRRVGVAFSTKDAASEVARREWLSRKPPKRTREAPVRTLRLVANDE